MNATVETILRYGLNSAFSALAAHNLVSASATGDWVNASVGLISALVPFATLAWGLYRSRLTAKIADVAASPKVTAIQTTPEIAAALPSDKVVAAPVSN